MRPPPDLAVRREVLEPLRSYMLKAPAGSGKTELLVQRVLNLLAVVAQPEEILAITFTRKAAGEMRKRVLDALDAAAQDVQSGSEHQALTRELAGKALARDAERGWNLRQNPQRLRIQTLDSFCAGVARRFPIEAGLGGLYATTEDAQPCYREAAARTLASGLHDAWDLLARQLDNRIDDVLERMARMLAAREQWLREIVARGSELRAHTEESLRALVVRQLESAREALASLPAKELSHVLAEVPKSVDPPNPAIEALREFSQLPPATPDALLAWRGLAELLLTREGKPRRGFSRAQGVLPLGEARGDEKARREGLRAAAKTLAAALEVGAAQALQKAGALPEPQLTDEAWARTEAVLHLLRQAAAELAVVFKDRGEVDFIEVALAARRSLGSPEDPSDLLLALDYRIRHILVDEFQDTSQSQIELLECLTAGWTPGDGRSLFLVGDGMQSIYRFRNAQVELFASVLHGGIGGLPLETRALSANFRSAPGLVDWVGRLFERLLSKRGAELYARAQAQVEGGPEGPTWHRLADAESEARRVVEIVQTALAKDAEGTVAILVRARKHLGQIIRELKDAGISFEATNLDTLGALPAVSDLLALTQALLRPADRLAWLAILRAPWVGLSLADLTRLADGVGVQEVFGAEPLRARVERLSEDGRARIVRLLTVLEPALAARGRGPLRPIVEAVWLALGGPAAVDEEQRAAAVLFFERLSALEWGGDLEDLPALAEDVAELFAPAPGEKPRVQLMTIHKAKGLEFETVILPGLERKPGNSPEPLLRWRAEPKIGLLLSPLPPRGAGKDPIQQLLKLLDAADEDAETLRLIYVALTRAKRDLHLCAVLPQKKTDEDPEPAAGSLLGRMWEAVSHELLDVPLAPMTGAIEPAPGPALGALRLAADSPMPVWAQADQEPEAKAGPRDLRPPFDWAQETARLIGVATHRLLYVIGRAGAEQWDEARLAALAPAARAILSGEGLAGSRLEETADIVLQALRRTLADPRGAWVLSGRHEEARCEWALSGRMDGDFRNLVIDRSFVAQGTRWIIDYKTGSHGGGDVEAFFEAEMARYRDQLEGYAALVSRLDSRPLRLALYFPRLGGWREWGWVPSRL